MADISVTAASVVKGTGAKIAGGTAGESITAGQPIYLKASDSRLYKADANVTSAEGAVVGIALHAAAAGQPLTYQTDGEITIGATVTVGETYIVSATAGGIAPIGDLATNSFVSYLGVGKTAAILTLNIYPTGIQKA